MEQTERVASVYEQTGSIKETARILKMSEQCVRRYLITQGLYTTPRIQEIYDLYKRGTPTTKIAERFGIKEKTVLAYLPYRRKPYKYNQTKNAKWIKRWRTKSALPPPD